MAADDDEPVEQNGADSFEEDAEPLTDEPGLLLLDLEGYEGPIEVLLALARDQKVDLTKISILQLADQYLDFISKARDLQLEIAADYLVMAAWLAYLKSRLLLPATGDTGEELSASEMAARLAFQLQRLEAMRNTGRALLERPQLNRDFFPRGDPEPVQIHKTSVIELSLYDLLKSYGEFQTRENIKSLRIDPSELYSTERALERLRKLIGDTPDWASLSAFLPQGVPGGLVARSAMAATFAACLELVKEGSLLVRQADSFAPLYIRQAGNGEAG